MNSRVLLFCNVTEKLIRRIVTMYEETKCCIRTSNRNTRHLKTVTGFKQGCSLSLLFFVVVDGYFFRLIDRHGI